MNRAECPRCEGAGVIIMLIEGPDLFGNYDGEEVYCPDCNGMGVLEEGDT